MVPSILAGSFVAGWSIWNSDFIGSSIEDYPKILALGFLNLGLSLPVAGTGVLPLTFNGYGGFMGLRPPTLLAHIVHCIYCLYLGGDKSSQLVPGAWDAGCHAVFSGAAVWIRCARYWSEY